MNRLGNTNLEHTLFFLNGPFDYHMRGLSVTFILETLKSAEQPNNV